MRILLEFLHGYINSFIRWPDGSDMGCARVSLLSLSKQNPDLLDISSVDDPTHGYRRVRRVFWG